MSDLATPNKPYEIIGQAQLTNRFDDALETTVPTWTVKAQWRTNKGIITVYIPDGPGWSANADIAIRQQGAELDALNG